jgi:hypothetical protein
MPLEMRLLVLPAESPEELALARRRTGVSFRGRIFSPDFNRVDLPRGELDKSSSVSSSSELLEAELRANQLVCAVRYEANSRTDLDEPA